MGSLSLLQGIFPTQGSNPALPHCRWILYQLSHKGKPKNTGVGSLSLLQWIFLTQELNRGLLHCRQILYQLSYWGSPVQFSRSVVSDSLRPHGPSSPWDSPGQSTGVGSLSLLQGIFPTQGSNPGLPHCRQTLYPLSHRGSPKVKAAQSCLTLCDPEDYTVHGILQARALEWAAFPFSGGSSQPRDRTPVSCIAGGFSLPPEPQGKPSASLK